MTKLLEKAFEEAAKLPSKEQDAFAKWLLRELESDGRWDDSFASSENVLEDLADHAVNEHEQGRTQPLDPDNL